MFHCYRGSGEGGKAGQALEIAGMDEKMNPLKVKGFFSPFGAR